MDDFQVKAARYIGRTQPTQALKVSIVTAIYHWAPALKDVHVIYGVLP